jgi:hypothetical protein
MSDDNFQGEMASPPRSVQQELKGPAIGLIVTGGLNALLAILLLLSGLVRLISGPSREIADDAERLGYLTGTIVGYSVAALSLVMAPIVIAGGVSMLRGKSLTLARNAAILAMIPVTSCCCIAGIPIGIWAFQSLRKPGVEEYFQRQAVPPPGSRYP